MLATITTEFIFHFFLIFARAAALIALLPGLGDERITLQTKIMFTTLLTLVLVPSINNMLPSFTTSSSSLLYYITSESLIGLMLGITVRIYHSSLQVLGNLISMQSGLSAATIFDPSQREQVMLFSGFIVAMTLVSIFVSDTHHIFLVGLIESYEKFTPGLMLDLGDVANRITEVVSSSFMLAFKISAPFLILGVAILIGSGVLSRLMPSLQVLFVITPLQILIMFASLFIVINIIINLVINAMTAVF